MPNSKEIINVPDERIISRILLIRKKKVMLDSDLAQLYKITTKRLNEQVKRNIKRFPEEFMFQLNKEELKIWKSQIEISNPSLKMGLRKCPYVFTEPGVAMLSSVLNSEVAIQVNIQIIKTFIKLREMLLTHKELREKIESMEKKYDKQFRVVFEAMENLLTEDEKPKREIGFKA